MTMMMKMAWEGLMKVKKLPSRQLLMGMAGKAKAGLQGPAGFLSGVRLEAYLGKLELARGVSIAIIVLTRMIMIIVLSVPYRIMGLCVKAHSLA